MAESAFKAPDTHATSATVRVDGARLWAEDTGGTGPAIVFSHGLFFTHRLFEVPVDRLRDRFRCVAYDHRGQGRSDAGGVRYAIDVERLYEDAVAVIESLDLAPCHWVGQSVGSYVGIRLAARRSDLVQSLVLLSPRVRPNTTQFVTQAEALCQAVRLTHAVRLDALIRRRLARYIMTEALGPSFMSDPTRRDDREWFQTDLAARITPAMIPAIRGTVRYPVHPLEMLGRVRVPTLLIAGEEDYSNGGGVEHAREVSAGIASARLTTIPHAGHGLLLEQPESVTCAISDFVADVERATVGAEPAR